MLTGRPTESSYQRFLAMYARRSKRQNRAMAELVFQAKLSNTVTQMKTWQAAAPAHSSDNSPQALEDVLPLAEEAFLDRLPVDDLPDVFQIGRLAIKILKVVGMLPHIHSKEQNVAGSHRILITRCHDAQATAGTIPDEPTPPAPLDSHKRGCEGALELGRAAPGLLDLGSELWRRLGARFGGSGGSKVCPEQGMVDVPAPIELDGPLQCYLGGDVAHINGSNVRLEGAVEICNIGLVMLAVVQRHNLS